jgi:hypothetical protein
VCLEVRNLTINKDFGLDKLFVSFNLFYFPLAPKKNFDNHFSPYILDIFSYILQGDLSELIRIDRDKTRKKNYHLTL